MLEIGTGSGYQACVLAKMGVKVFTIERQKKLFDRAKETFKALNIPNVKVFYGDGFEGVPAFAPYDKVLITAAAPEVPVKLLEQLSVGGYLVMPYGKGKVQKMQRIIKTGDQQYEQEEYDNFKFVPMLKGKAF